MGIKICTFIIFHPNRPARNTGLKIDKNCNLSINICYNGSPGNTPHKQGIVGMLCTCFVSTMCTCFPNQMVMHFSNQRAHIANNRLGTSEISWEYIILHFLESLHLASDLIWGKHYLTIEQLCMKPILFRTPGFLVEQIASEWQGWHSHGEPASTNSTFRFRPISTLSFGFPEMALARTPGEAPGEAPGEPAFGRTRGDCLDPKQSEKLTRLDTAWHGDSKISNQKIENSRLGDRFAFLGLAPVSTQFQILLSSWFVLWFCEWSDCSLALPVSISHRAFPTFHCMLIWWQKLCWWGSGVVAHANEGFRACHWRSPTPLRSDSWRHGVPKITAGWSQVIGI